VFKTIGKAKAIIRQEKATFHSLTAHFSMIRLIDFENNFFIEHLKPYDEFSSPISPEDVMVASHTRTAERFINILTRSKKMRKTEAAVESNAMTLLELVGLADYRYEYAPSLPYGLQRKLEIARAMAAEPEIILLDEPAAGMNDRETSEMAKFILEIRDMGFTVVLIEHDMRLVMGICDRVYVLNFGSLIAEGCCEDVKTNPAVIEAYLGKEVQLNASTRS
jgi:branched-chain amino acid transport system ATP-binding protein